MQPIAIDDPDLNSLRSRAWWISVVLWIFEVVLLEMLRRITDLEMTWSLAIGRAIWAGSGLLLGVVIWKICEPFQRLPFWKLAALVMGLFLFFGSLHTIANRALFYWILDYWPPSEALLFEYYVNVRYWLHFYMAWAAIILALVYATQVSRDEVGRSEAQILAQQARIQAFRYQIHPHFLFNSFNSIAALILDGKRHAAERMIRRLSDYLRRGLSREAMDDLPLGEEIAQELDYLKLEKARFPERLSIETDVDDDLGSGRVMVPGFILQPLVENAVRHGVMESLALTTITISAYRDGEWLVISVVNSSAQPLRTRTANGKEKGLGHVRARLTARYGQNFRLEAGHVGPATYRARMTIPFREKAV